MSEEMKYIIVEDPNGICEEFVAANVLEKHETKKIRYVLNSLIYEEIRDKINKVITREERKTRQHIVDTLIMTILADVIKKKLKLYSDFDNGDAFVEYLCILLKVALESTDLDTEFNLNYDDILKRRNFKE